MRATAGGRGGGKPVADKAAVKPRTRRAVEEKILADSTAFLWDGSGPKGGSEGGVP